MRVPSSEGVSRWQPCEGQVGSDPSLCYRFLPARPFIVLVNFGTYFLKIQILSGLTDVGIELRLKRQTLWDVLVLLSAKNAILPLV